MALFLLTQFFTYNHVSWGIQVLVNTLLHWAKWAFTNYVVNMFLAFFDQITYLPLPKYFALSKQKQAFC